jgi:hypothetical protein
MSYIAGRPISEGHHHSVRYLQACAGQSVVPATSIRAPTNTRPFRFESMKLCPAPHIYSPADINEAELVEAIRTGLKQFIWGYRPEPIIFHAKWDYPANMQNITPVSVIVDVPMDMEITAEATAHLIDWLPKYEGFSWAFSEITQAESALFHSFRLNWFVEEIIDRESRMPIIFAKYDSSVFEGVWCMSKIVR